MHILIQKEADIDPVYLPDLRLAYPG